MEASGTRPVLWHIPVSHYSEKVRWALDHKRVAHSRRPVPPPAHMAFALALTRGRGYTLPLLQTDEQVLGDSTAIIAALEREHPQRPLYPSDPGERRRALELEDFFDEQLGPYARRVGFHELRSDPAAMADVAAAMLPAAAARNASARNAAGRIGRSFAALRYGTASEAGADAARAKILAAFDRLEAELGDGDYLVGDRFTVADLTAASLFYPVVLPPQAVALPEPTPAYERFLAPLRDRRGFRWVREMFARHRG